MCLVDLGELGLRDPAGIAVEELDRVGDRLGDQETRLLLHDAAQARAYSSTVTTHRREEYAVVDLLGTQTVMIPVDPERDVLYPGCLRRLRWSRRLFRGG